LRTDSLFIYFTQINIKTPTIRQRGFTSQPHLFAGTILLESWRLQLNDTLSLDNGGDSG